MKNHLLTMIFLVMSHLGWSQLNITGKVTDAAGEPLIGAVLHEEGTDRVSITDADGMFTISVRSELSLLEVRMLGYAPMALRVGSQRQFEFKLVESSILDAVSIVGSRSLNRSKINSPVPIDIIDVKELTNSQGQLDINQLLQFAAPSFNANRQTGADGSDHVDPATLRGLGPDQTLVLINGKRRHQSSLVNLYGTRGRGNTGTDLNAIPAASIERVEILRDGASAQYGSDAIAGVINIVLKESIGFNANLNVGAHQAQDNPARDIFDGENYQLSSNYGFKLGEQGFVNVTGDYWFRGHTNRFDPSLYRRQFGDAQGSNFNTSFNLSLPLGSQASLYAFGGQNLRQTEAYAWSRDPGSARNVDALYPNGFDPRILSDITDRSLTAGVKGTYKNWGMDFSHGFGSNRFHYFGEGTVNASLEERSPTSFDDGGFSLSQHTSNFDISRYFKNCLAGTNLAFGVEHRLENYRIFAGEEASWKTYGPVLFSQDSVFENEMFVRIDSTYRPGGAQGFPGFGPQNEVNKNRTNLGAFADVDMQVTKAFTVAAALRFERYSDFGNTLNGKLALRYKIAPSFAVRASGSTGFRAPSLAQKHFNSVYTDFVSGVAVDKFLAANGSNITTALGIPDLKEETSVNLGAGLTYNMDDLNVSLDAYHIQIKDRIVLTGDFYNDDPDIGLELQKLQVGSARFFANAINTKSTGVDLVISKIFSMTEDFKLNLILTGNYNNMEIDAINVPTKLQGKEDFFLSNRERLFILASAPPLKANLNLQFQYRQHSLNLRCSYFDKITLEDYIGEMDIYEARTVLDLSATFKLTNNFQWTLGVSNLLNAYPSPQDAETEGGGLYDAVQMGFNGRFLFTKFAVRF